MPIVSGNLDKLVKYFMAEHQVSEREAIALLTDSLADFEVVKAVLKSVDRRVNGHVRAG